MPRGQVLVPNKLTETDALVCKESGVAVYRVLMVPVGTELKLNVLVKWQFVGTEKLPPVGVNALPVNVGAAAVEVLIPVELTAESVFMHQPSCKGEQPVVLAQEIPFVEQGNAVLKRHVCEPIPVLVHALAKVKGINAHKRLRLGANLNLHSRICICFPPGSAENIDGNLWGVGGGFGDDVNQSSHCF